MGCLVCTQLHACAIELKRCLCACPVREMAVIFDRIRPAHGTTVCLGLPVRPELIIAEPEQAVPELIVIDLQCIQLVSIFFISLMHLDLVNCRKCVRLCDHQPDSLCIHRLFCRCCCHRADLCPRFSEGLPLAVLIQVFQIESSDRAALLLYRHLIDHTGGECICYCIAAGFLRWLPVCLTVRIESKGCICPFSCRISISCCISIPEVEVGFPASQCHGKLIIAQLHFLDPAASIFIHIILVHHVKRVFCCELRIHRNCDLLACIVG